MIKIMIMIIVMMIIIMIMVMIMITIMIMMTIIIMITSSAFPLARHSLSVWMPFDAVLIAFPVDGRPFEASLAVGRPLKLPG